MTQSVEIQKEMAGGQRSKLAAYRDLVIGRPGLWPLLRFELTQLLLANLPGALGLFLRGKCYPGLFKSCGRGVVFGARLTLRHPHKIEIGAGTVLDDNVVLDAKGADNKGIRIGQGAFIGRDTILSCKNGDIILGDRVNLGFRCEIFSGSRVELADSVLVAAYTYLVGGGHPADRLDVPVLEQGHISRGIHVETGVWLGAGVIVLDGLRIGAHAIIGAGAVVSRDVPAYHIAAGVPARLVRDRRADQDPGAP